jgi:hypothetical protein
MLQQLDIAIAFVVLMLMLSLLVTAMVQAISAVLDLRGRNLVRALADLFKQIDPGLRAKAGKNFGNWLAHPFTRETTLATQLADAIATHPILAHTFTRAKAIRKDELLDVLQDLCSDHPNSTVGDAVQTRLKAMLASQLPGGAASTEAAQALAAKIVAQVPQEAKDAVSKAVVDTLGKVSSLEAGVEKWFDTAMDRASDIFTRWTRTITIAISLLLAVVLQIDAGSILNQISTNSDVRAGLIKISDAALSRAEDLEKESHRGSTALKQFITDRKLAIAESNLNDMPPFGNCDQAASWLEQSSPKDPNTSQLRTDFPEVCRKAAAEAFADSRKQVSGLQSELASTRLKFIPDGVFGSADDKTFGQKVGAWWHAYLKPRHLLGTLAMVILLSLGAPFWYNALKQLSNLKPAITQKVENESSTSS